MSNTVIKNLKLLFKEAQETIAAIKINDPEAIIDAEKNIVLEKAYDEVKSCILSNPSGTLAAAVAEGFYVEQIHNDEYDFTVISIKNDCSCINFNIPGPKSQYVEPRYSIIYNLTKLKKPD